MSIPQRARLFLLTVIVLLALGGVAVYVYVASDRIAPTSALASKATGPLSADLPASGIERLAVTADAGEMKITASTDDKVHVQLDLRQRERSIFWLFNWLSGETARDVQGAALKLDRQGDSLSVSFAYPSGDSHSDVQEKWTISLPAKLLLDVEMGAGQMVIDGMQGGIKAHLVAGETVIHAASGPIEAHVTYGRLHVISTSPTPGLLDVTANHGLAVMSLDGKYYGPPEEHGFWSHVHLIGNSVEQQEKGKDDMHLRVSYGEADLRVGPLGDSKDYRSAFTDD